MGIGPRGQGTGRHGTLRRYEASLDLKIYEDELEQSKSRKDGANPLVHDKPITPSGRVVA